MKLKLGIPKGSLENATIDLFRISAILIVLLIPAVWICGKAMAQGGAAHAAD